MDTKQGRSNMLVLSVQSGAARLMLVVAALTLCVGAAHAADATGAPKEWVNDLRPIDASQWTRERAAHLLERAGFGATPQDIEHYLKLGARDSVTVLVRPQNVDDPRVGPFEPSGIP